VDVCDPAFGAALRSVFATRVTCVSAAREADTARTRLFELASSRGVTGDGSLPWAACTLHALSQTAAARSARSRMQRYAGTTHVNAHKERVARYARIQPMPWAMRPHRNRRLWRQQKHRPSLSMRAHPWLAPHYDPLTRFRKVGLSNRSTAAGTPTFSRPTALRASRHCAGVRPSDDASYML